MNRPVHARPIVPWTPSGIDRRRIVRGGLLPFVQMVVIGPRGEFQLEWNRADEIRLIAVKGIAREGEGQFLSVTPGQTYRVVLRDER